ncbi:MAG: hypothetical protein ACSHXF_00450 [Aquaticitalea sp.]
MLFQHLLLSALLLTSCDTGKLIVIADIPNHLKEVSAVETTPTSDFIWMIEDAGNDNHIYAMDEKGTIKKDLVVLNSENKDWEDLTSDTKGNLYIGDFGNNSKKRKTFTIYKLVNPEEATDEISSEQINFEFPKGTKSEDFEAFFVFNNQFYIFSKDSKKCRMFKVPNQVGKHTAELMDQFELEGKHNRITSADISTDGRTVVLLNHVKVWRLSDFESDHFSGGKIEELKFGHNSQKEGVCFRSHSTLLITDESNGADGSNLYAFEL